MTSDVHAVVFRSNQIIPIAIGEREANSLNAMHLCICARVITYNYFDIDNANCNAT